MTDSHNQSPVDLDDNLWRWEKDMRNAVRARNHVSTLSIIMAFGMLGVLLGGCYALILGDSIPYERLDAEIYDDGSLYFALPADRKYEEVYLFEFSVNKIEDINNKNTFWSFNKSSDNIRKRQDAKTKELPLKYGAEGPGRIVKVQPKEVTNGEYKFRGSMDIKDEKGWHWKKVGGEFIYENGAVRNLW